MKPFRAMAVSGMLGYGFTQEAFRRGLELDLDLIACDAGSAVLGPYYLGSGAAFVSCLATKRDLEAKALSAGARDLKEPLAEKMLENRFLKTA